MEWISHKYVPQISGVKLLSSKNNPFTRCNLSAAGTFTYDPCSTNVRHYSREQYISSLHDLLRRTYLASLGMFGLANIERWDAVEIKLFGRVI
jgi:hypothetical protein